MAISKCWLLIFLLWVSLVGQDIFSNRMLIAVNPSQAPLPTGEVSELNEQIDASFYTLLQKYHVVRIEKWLKSADANDVFGGVDFSKVYRLYFEKGSLLKRAFTEFSQNSSIKQVSFEPKIKIAIPIEPTIPNDPYLSRQYYLNKIQAEYVWSLLDRVPTPKQPILIGIVDTGIDYHHPEMEPVLYVNPGEDINHDGIFSQADLNGIDDDNNGFVDDVRGWDFSNVSDSTNGDNDIRPPNAGNYEILSHGTHVAGIVGATSNNGQGISGITRFYKIIATKHSLDNDLTHGYLYNAYDGILYCAKLGATVINCSWGGQGYSSLAQQLIDMVRQKYGAIVVAAAGNDNNNNDVNHFYPSDLDGVVTVAALTPGDRKASFSNYGQVIDISAPGTGILSTIHFYKGGYATWQGTSMASPVVAGSIALIKYFYPDFSADELVQKVLDTADPIDSLNPAYAGLLGTGRVNIYNAVAPKFLPALTVIQDSLWFDDVNENSQIDPGEMVSIILKIKNNEGWQPAKNVEITASSKDSLLLFNQPSVYLGNLEPGDQFWTAQPIKIKVIDNHPYSPIKLSFTISGQTTDGQAITEHYEKQVLLSMFQKNFPLPNTSTDLPVSVISDSGSGAKRLAFISTTNQLFLMDYKGQIIPPFPIDLSEFHRVPQVIADIDGDGQQEIITLSNYGKLKVFKQNGQLLLNLNLNEVVYGSFAVADLDGDGTREFVIATMRKKLHVLDARGKEFAGFPIHLDGFAPKGVAIADVNGDGLKEIVLGTFDNKLHLFSLSGDELPNWPVELSASVAFAPVIGKDIKGVFIGIINKKNQLQIFNIDGTVRLTTNLRSKVTQAPFLMDFNNDGLLEFWCVTQDSSLIGFSSNKRKFQFQLSHPITALPLVFTTNQGIRLVTVDNKGSLSVYGSTFKMRSYAPIYLPFTLRNSLTLSDIDNDGDVEAILSSSEQLVALDLPENENDLPCWHTYLANEQRTSYFEIDSVNTTGLKSIPLIPRNIRLQAYPNPFNSKIKIQLKTPWLTNKAHKVEVKIFDIQGRLVCTLFNQLSAQKKWTLYWDGTNNQGYSVGSGVYFLHVTISGNQQLIKKISYIK